MKIYVITVGEYSDYHICAVTDNLTSAENLKQYYTTSDYSVANIEEYETTDMLKKPKTCWYCRYDPRDSIMSCVEVRYVSKEDEEYGLFWETEINDVGYSLGEFYVYVFAEDKEHAKKIAAEQIYQSKYKGELMGNDPWNKPLPNFGMSKSISLDMIEKLKEGNPINGMSISFEEGVNL